MAPTLVRMKLRADFTQTGISLCPKSYTRREPCSHFGGHLRNHFSMVMTITHTEWTFVICMTTDTHSSPRHPFLFLLLIIPWLHAAQGLIRWNPPATATGSVMGMCPKLVQSEGISDSARSLGEDVALWLLPATSSFSGQNVSPFGTRAKSGTFY